LRGRRGKGGQDYNKKRNRMSNRRSNEFIASASADHVDVGEPVAAEQERLLRLARVIEGEIIPRLLISLSVGVRAARPTAPEQHAGADPQPGPEPFQANATPPA
jgi:hypothetical protein